MLVRRALDNVFVLDARRVRILEMLSLAASQVDWVGMATESVVEGLLLDVRQWIVFAARVLRRPRRERAGPVSSGL